MTLRNSSALNRHYYPLSEATKTLKGWGTNLSINDLLHHGAQGRVRFFIHVPSGTRVRQIRESPQCNNYPQPTLLILSPLHCGEIECNKSTEQSDFPSAYASLYSYTENPPYPKDSESIESMYWQAIDSNGEIERIRITLQTICICHSELTQLHQWIDSAYKPPIEFSLEIDEPLKTEINLRCYSFEDALNIAKGKIDGFTEIHLLRYGYFEKLTFLIPRPKTLAITIAHENDPLSTPIAEFLPPDLLALHPEDCYQIEIFGSTQRTDYKTGFLCSSRTLIPYPPSAKSDLIYDVIRPYNLLTIGNYRLRANTEIDDNLIWRTYYGSSKFQFVIQKENVYVLRSEFDPMINVVSKNEDPTQYEFEYTPEFTFSVFSKYILSPKKFATLHEASKLAKCSETQLLSCGSQGLIEFLTPVPCEIALCQAQEAVADLDILRRSQSSFVPPVSEIPQLLVVDKSDCKALTGIGQLKRGYFKAGYSIEGDQLRLCEPTYRIPVKPDFSMGDDDLPRIPFNIEIPPGVWLTFYLDKPKEIDITVDRIFIELSRFKQLIESSTDIFKLQNESFCETERSRSDQFDLRSPEMISTASCETSRTDLTCDALLSNDISVSVEIVTKKQLADMAGISMTTINNKTKQGHKYEDPDFPKKYINEKNGYVHFLKPEVDVWIRKNPPRNRKRNPP